jgi:hypothetical protein
MSRVPKIGLTQRAIFKTNHQASRFRFRFSQCVRSLSARPVNLGPAG